MFIAGPPSVPWQSYHASTKTIRLQKYFGMRLTSEVSHSRALAWKPLPTPFSRKSIKTRPVFRTSQRRQRRGLWHFVLDIEDQLESAPLIGKELVGRSCCFPCFASPSIISRLHPEASVPQGKFNWRCYKTSVAEQETE